MICVFLFYDKGIGKQSIYTTHGIEHCNVICFNGKDFMLFESSKSGIGFRRIKARMTTNIIRHIKNIKSLIHIFAVRIYKQKELKWFPLWIRSCNEICRYMSGIDIGFTLNPTQFIKKLLKYDGKRNYEILYTWSA